MTRRRPPDAGYATAELAAAFPAVVLLLLAGLFTVTAVTTQTRCADAAREAALAEARGENGESAAAARLPPNGTVSVASGADTVTATVSAPVRPLGTLLPPVTVNGKATAANEKRGQP